MTVMELKLEYTLSINQVYASVVSRAASQPPKDDLQFTSFLKHNKIKWDKLLRHELLFLLKSAFLKPALKCVST